jgi:hypothetical protein
MSAAAKPLGGEPIAQEQTLDRVFANGGLRLIVLWRRRLPLRAARPFD